MGESEVEDEYLHTNGLLVRVWVGTDDGFGMSADFVNVLYSSQIFTPSYAVDSSLQ